MILGDATHDKAAAEPTLDDVFRRATARRSDAIALADPPNRAAFTEGLARELTYTEADKAISIAAGRLQGLGLRTDDVVAIQLGNTVESVIALLAVLRAGMIAAPIPLLWRRGEAADALGRAGAKALIACGHIGDFAQGDAAREIAARVFSIQHVCGFGTNLPDGVTRLDKMVATDPPLPNLDRGKNPGAHLAAITFDLGADGFIPVARSHAELISGGLAVLLESGIAQEAVILTTLMGGSFAALATGVVPWLLSGGTLALHQPLDVETFARQRREMQPDMLVLPGAMITPLADAGLLEAGDGLETVIAVWRAPERLTRAGQWRDPAIGMIDVRVFGESGLVVARRGIDGKPAPVPFGPLTAPRGGEAAAPVGDVMPTDVGTVALRGPMVPRHAFPPAAERDGLPHLRVLAGGYVDTGYACRLDRDTQGMAATGPPPGLINVGGYRFRAGALEETVHQADARATLAALPDGLAGHRLAGTAPDTEALRATLARLGVNPLVIAAFPARSTPP